MQNDLQILVGRMAVMNATIEMIKPPTKFGLIREITAPLDWLSVGWKARELSRTPKGDGRPVLLLPGYRSSHRAMVPLASFLRSKNYDAYHWRLGMNRGYIDEYVALVGERLEREFDEPVTLIGWSLGGVIARELARLYAPHVREIITMGTPIIGGPKYTAAADSFAKMHGVVLDDFETYVHEINSIGLEQPITAFYSKTDGVVSWRAAVDTYNPQARNIEVGSTHFGIGINADVWMQIAETLSAS